MRLIALLSWYDEQPAWLAELVASLLGTVDHLVAVDGAYAFFPQARGSSGSEQAEVVIGTALGAGLGVTVHVPQSPWPGNEVHKRTVTFALGHLVADPGEDWLVVADADEVWTSTAGLREHLACTDLDVAEVLVHEARDGAHEVERQLIRKCFRAQPGGIRVVGTHSHYVCDAGTLWAPSSVAQAPAEQLMDVQVRHRPDARAAYRDRKRWAYYDRRVEFALESLA